MVEKNDGGSVDVRAGARRHIASVTATWLYSARQATFRESDEAIRHASRTPRLRRSACR